MKVFELLTKFLKDKVAPEGLAAYMVFPFYTVGLPFNIHL